MQTVNLNEFAPLVRRPIPDAVAAIPSMMSRWERNLLYGLARDVYRGAGVILDAGVFCGASTMCFGTGVRDNPASAAILKRYPQPVRTFEYGVVNPGMIAFFARHGVAGDWAVGGSFEAYLRGNIAPVAHLTTLTIGDIATKSWSGEPIEIMFLDVVKSADIQRHVLRNFFPALMPGALLIQQDYFIDGLPFLRITQEALAPWFDYLGEVQSSALFRLREAIPAAMLASDPGDALSFEDRFALLCQARDRSVDPDRRLLCDLGTVRFLATQDVERARAWLADIERRHPRRFGDDEKPRLKMAMRHVANAVRAPRRVVA